MIWYVIITELIWTTSGGRVFCKRISDDVKSGNIAYNMNKPYSYISYSICSHLGSITVKAIITFITSFGIGSIFLNDFPTLSLPSVLIVLVSGILAVLISSLLTAFIGLISFFIEDSKPIFWVYSKMILILGVVFPVEFFPESLAVFIRYSPIYVICYGPAKLFVNFDYQTAVEILMSQVVYLIIAWTMCQLLYMKGVKKLNVTGG